MALLKETNYKGKTANYWGKYFITYSKAEDKTTFIIYLYWDELSANLAPLAQLDFRKYEFIGNKTPQECYAFVKEIVLEGEEVGFFADAEDV